MTKTFSILTLALALPLLAPTAAQACFAADCPGYALTGVIVPEHVQNLPARSVGPWLPGILATVAVQAAGATDDPAAPFQTGMVIAGPANLGLVALGRDCCRLFPLEVGR
ncbi:hypothetical protein KUL25_07525 [Rhodobacteraceae bacterium N5(2021)]|uniref:Uncharacterized protein n=1 Tax=Gymnodinialimonas phycosphaerae TaxID=2841589 RepID=A0A975YHB8_9RHOB|nr:hypothetical protein [Gymnodinialimonas phycosphaerae]MBY4892613.1 hypothetical protein [Gymnodinialimonas phycosphaerae]